MSKKKYSLREDPEARKLLADLQALLERAEALSKKADHESKTTGHLWGVCGYLTNAVARAEDDILHLCEFCGDLVRDEKGAFHQKCYDAAAAEPPTEAEIQAALDFGRTAEQHLAR